MTGNALRLLHQQVVDHVANLGDKQPWENAELMKTVERVLREQLVGLRELPATFAGNRIVGAVKVAEDPSLHPNRWVIMTHDGRRGFNVHVVAHNGTEWVGGQGRYDMPFSRAIDRLAHEASFYGRPAEVDRDEDI